MVIDTLFLDDDPKRHATFRSLNKNADMVWTADEAIAAIEKPNSYRFMHLDHDLGGKQFVASDSPEGTGYTVAEFIVKRYVGSRLVYPEIFIHSFNQEGAIRMLKLLYSAGFSVSWKPFREF